MDFSRSRAYKIFSVPLTSESHLYISCRLCPKVRQEFGHPSVAMFLLHQITQVGLVDFPRVSLCRVSMDSVVVLQNHQPIYPTGPSCDSACGINPYGVRGDSFRCGFVQQSLSIQIFKHLILLRSSYLHPD